MTATRLAAAFALLAAIPFLPAAGCRAHYTARIDGAIAHAHPQHAGKTVRVIYRTDACDEPFRRCVLESDKWRPLRECSEKRDAPVARFTVVAGAVAPMAFRHCTHMVGVDYRADIVAFIDLDDDGVLDAGEPYGAAIGLSRDAEPTALPLSIRIDEVLDLREL